MIQKYDRWSYVEIALAISDLGKGVRRSLVDRHGDVADTAAGYIERALGGLSARPGERGGQGLDAIRRIAVASGGNFFIRSETGGVLSTATGAIAHDALAFFPGTQLSITFRSRTAR